MSVLGERREKAALSSGCKSHPANRSSRKRWWETATTGLSGVSKHHEAVVSL